MYSWTTSATSNTTVTKWRCYLPSWLSVTKDASVAISTNLVFSDWNRIFKDPMTTMAAIDRVVHHSVILDLMAMDSFRAREAGHEHTPPTPPEPEPPADPDMGQAA